MTEPPALRPATLHCVAQLVRHARGLVTTVDKFVAQTPPEALPGECAALVWIARGALADLITTLETPRSPTAPISATPLPDRPAALRPPDRS